MKVLKTKPLLLLQTKGLTMRFQILRMKAMKKCAM